MLNRLLRRVAALLVLSILSIAVEAQIAAEPTPSPSPTQMSTKESAEFRSFIDDTLREINGVRLPENRLSFNAEAASLL